jgi:SAM-dependent methyltransferase
VTPLPAGYRVLEVGCGTGNVLRVLERKCAGGSVFGVELFGEGVEYARRRVNCPVTTGDIRDGHPGAPFDIIGMFDVLEHIEDDLTTLRQIGDVLTARGRILLTVPAHPELWSDFDVASHHHRRYTEASLRAVFGQAGFTVEYLTPFMSILYPLMRMRRRAPAGAVDARAVVDDEFRVIPVANVLAYCALLPESIAVGRGWRIPMGTSLLAVARRNGP